MTSLWLDRDRPAVSEPFPGDQRCDVAVIGAGLTGLTTALLLARAGSRVVVLEGRRVGSGTTGNTTAKVSLLQGTRLSAIVRRHSAATGERYVDANREGQAWLLRYCADHKVPFQIRPAYSYAATQAGGPAAREELAAGLARVCDEII